MVFQIHRDNRKNVDRLAHARVAVLGAARSGVAVARLLKRHGATVLVSEIKPREELPEEVNRLEREGILLETGGHSDALFSAELVVLSPGISLQAAVVRELQARGIPIVGELEIASWFCRAPMVAITGSNGKSTTTALIGALLQRRYSAVLVGGNIGTPFSAQLLEKPYAEVAVLEVSSFQLETIVNFKPAVAVLTNLSPDHLDRYPDFSAYAAAKMRIGQNFSGEEWLLSNADDPELQKRVPALKARHVHFSLAGPVEQGAWWEGHHLILRVADRQEVLTLPGPRLAGPHNRYNMAAAALAAYLLGVKAQDIQQVLETFPGLPHRLEVVGRWNEITFVNDSKATTVESLRVALLSFDRPVVLIAGGRDKGSDFRQVVPLLRQKVRAAVLLGEAREKLMQAWNGEVPLMEARDLEQAVQKAFQLAMPGDVVLLAPACASFDMFRDYQDRGDQFRRLVQRMIGQLKSLGRVQT